MNLFPIESLKSGPLNVLCLGAHCDDIDIGCGGTLLALSRRPDVRFTWVVFSSNESREREARNSFDAFHATATDSKLIVKQFRDGFLPYAGAEVKDEFEALKREIEPDLIFTHTRDDLHQDHRKICELTWNTFRNHLILEYEIPKWDGDLGNPNCYVALDEDIASRKIDILMESYTTQANKGWFTRDLFHALMRIRGMECHSHSGLAEAFIARKFAVGV